MSIPIEGIGGPEVECSASVRNFKHGKLAVRLDGPIEVSQFPKATVGRRT